MKNQTIKIHPIVVVDDGSIDATPTIAVEKGCELVQLPYHVESYVAMPEMANVCNAGLEHIKTHGIPDFIIQMGADHILSYDYVESIISKMGNPVKIASGATQFKRINRNTPWGSGRIIDAKLWNEINGMKYPVAWGYESWIIYKVRSMGYEVRRYDEIPSSTRKIRMNPDKAFKWGKCSYALGCSLPFALSKALTYGFNSIYYMKGYFARARVDKHEDIAKFVRKNQYQQAIDIILGSIFNLSPSIPTANKVKK